MVCCLPWAGITGSADRGDRGTRAPGAMGPRGNPELRKPIPASGCERRLTPPCPALGRRAVYRLQRDGASLSLTFGSERDSQPSGNTRDQGAWKVPAIHVSTLIALRSGVSYSRKTSTFWSPLLLVNCATELSCLSGTVLLPLYQVLFTLAEPRLGICWSTLATWFRHRQPPVSHQVSTP